MRNWELIGTVERGPFTIFFEKTYEDIDPWYSLSECYANDKQKLYDDIDSGKLDWFMLRTRVILADVAIGYSYLGGMLYENPRDILTDGVAEDQIASVIEDAKVRFAELKNIFATTDINALTTK